MHLVLPSHFPVMRLLFEFRRLSRISYIMLSLNLVLLIMAVNILPSVSQSLVSDTEFDHAPNISFSVPSSCAHKWFGSSSYDATYLNAAIAVGRSCAVVTRQGCINPWECEGTPCDTLQSLCSTQYSTVFLQYIASGPITGTTSFNGYRPDRKLLGVTASLVSAASYDPSWRYVAKPPCCGTCRLQGDEAQLYAWPNTEVPTHSNISIGAIKISQSTVVTSIKDQVSYTLVSNGFTL